MDNKILHVTFGDSAYGALRIALLKAKRDEEIITLIDSLSFGPIDTLSQEERQAWMEAELGFEREEGFEARVHDFWQKLLTDKRHKVIWTSRRSAMDYTGFLECLWRLGDKPCSVVDLTNVWRSSRDNDGNLRSPTLAIALPFLNEEAIISSRIDAITASDRSRYHTIWEQLRRENAPFRLVSDEGIASAPITCFDNDVLSCVKKDWQKSTRVIGEVMVRDWPMTYIQTGDHVYFSRLQKLVEAGIVESRGDMSKMRSSEVRLAANIPAISG